MKKGKIMIVEDEMIIAEDITKIVQFCGYQISCLARTGEEAIQKAEQMQPDLVLMDIMLSGEMTGLEAANIIHQKLNIPFVFVSAYADDATLKKAIATEPYGYVVKPFEEKELKVILELAFYKFKMENKLKKSQEKYRHIFENIQDIYCEFDLDLNLIEISPSIESYTSIKREELIGKKIIAMFSDQNQVDAMLSLFENVEVLNDFEINLASRENEKIIGSVQGKMIRESNTGNKKIVCSIRDITKQKAMEKQIMRTERLAGVGQLAAGIAHEIRNPLGNISSAIQYCLTKYKPKEPLSKYLQIVLRNSESANQIIKELLEFANPRDIDLQQLNLTNVLKDTVDMVKAKCETNKIDIKLDFPDNIPEILIDGKWIQQCFLNFILNSIDAIRENGEIIIKIELFANCLLVTVKDDGCGISREHINKIFDPFYTTKADGTGLGLSLVYQIIIAHQGSVDIESEIGVGTSVFVRLPIQQK